jgi:N6-adenosine-specific RNA methylase IME4
LGHVVSLNLERRHLTESQRAIVALDILPRLEAEAKARQRISRGRGIKGAAKLPQVKRGRARDDAAQLVKVSPRYVQDAKKIAANAPDLAVQVRNGVLTLPEAKMLCGLTPGDRAKILKRKVANPNVNLWLEYQALHKRRILRKATSLATVQGRYQVLLCDCPWDSESTPGSKRHADSHYPTMSISELKALPVQNLSASDSVLFMWTTIYRLKDALEIMEAWGFSYASNIVWVKGPQWGLGHWVRNRHELLLIGRRGHLPAPVTIPGSVLQTHQHNRHKRHSEKPSEVYALIEKMFPGANARRLELFARGNPREGWAQWGAETEGIQRKRKTPAILRAPSEESIYPT